MSGLSSSLYAGEVMHRRYRPRRHELRYDVVNLFADVDELATLSRRSWLFGYGQRKLFSVQDRNHGAGDGTPIASHIRGVMQGLKTARPVARIFMFCYPAVLGRVFNPLTVYFGLDAEERLTAIVYEVNNTFGQRHSYALAVDGDAPHQAQKEFYVSPFNPAEGEYRFTCGLDEKHLRLNIALFEGQALKLCARFEGERRPLSDAVLLRSLASLAFQPVKIVAAIHWEALKLFLKGLRPLPRPAHAKYSISQPKVKS